MKKILISSMASILLLSSTTYAQGSVTHNTSFSKKDAQALFGTNKVKATTLNNGEMKKTEGAFGWWGGLAGAGYGAYSYLGHSLGSGHFSWSGLGASTAGGAATGIITPTPTALMYIHRTHALMAGGAVSGILGR